MSADSDEYLIRYILRDLPENEAERLDEQSVTDEAFATRLRVCENDLVDPYAPEGPADEPLERLQQRLRDSAYLRSKVQFARALQAVSLPAGTAVSPKPVLAAERRPWLEAVAAAAMLLLVATGYLGLQTVSLRQEIARLQAEPPAVEPQNARLPREVEGTPATPQQPTTAAYLLRPPRRGAGEQTLTVPPDTAQVLLRIVIESSDYKMFWAALQDSASSRTVWRSGDLPATVDGGNRIVQVTIPVSLLTSGRYSLDVSGSSAVGTFEPAGSYPLRIVLE